MNKQKNLWCLTIKDKDRETIDIHVFDSVKKPTYKQALMLVYGLDKKDEYLEVLTDKGNFELELKKVKIFKGDF